MEPVSRRARAALGKAALILVPFVLLAATVVPRVMARFVPANANDEMLPAGRARRRFARLPPDARRVGPVRWPLGAFLAGLPSSSLGPTSTDAMNAAPARFATRSCGFFFGHMAR